MVADLSDFGKIGSSVSEPLAGREALAKAVQAQAAPNEEELLAARDEDHAYWWSVAIGL